MGEPQGLLDHPSVGEVRGMVLLLGLPLDVDLVEGGETRQSASVEEVARVVAGCKERGLIVGKNGGTVAGFNNV